MPLLNASWVAGEDIAPRLIVRQDTASPRQILKATLGHYPVGVSVEGGIYAPIPEVSSQLAALSGGQCRVYGPGEECEIEVGSVAITIGDFIAPDANSKAQPGVHNFPVLGIALDNGPASKKVRCRIMVPELCNRASVVLTKTADYTLALSDLGKVLTNTGAGAAVTFALPAAVVGYQVRARLGAAQALRLDPNGTETIALPSTGVQGAAGKYLTADAVGEGVILECRVAGTWDVVSYTGTWTAES